jgi:hypothetical protein
MSRLLVAVLTVVAWASPASSEPSVLNNINLVSYVIAVDDLGSHECKIDKANLETSLRFIADSSRLKLISAKVMDEKMPTLSFGTIASSGCCGLAVRLTRRGRYSVKQ